MLLLAACSKGPYDDERGSWKLMCAAIVGPAPAATVDAEFSGQHTPDTEALFDEYLLRVSPDQFPSPVRNDLAALRQADIDYRAGKINADQAKAAGVSGVRALTEHAERGACAYFWSQWS
jgi:hypothetical protein